MSSARSSAHIAEQLVARHVVDRLHIVQVGLKVGAGTYHRVDLLLARDTAIGRRLVVHPRQVAERRDRYLPTCAARSQYIPGAERE